MHRRYVHLEAGVHLEVSLVNADGDGGCLALTSTLCLLIDEQRVKLVRDSLVDILDNDSIAKLYAHFELL